jgi:hypothetical protein
MLLRQASVVSSQVHLQKMRKALVAGLEDQLEFVTRNMAQLREPG